MILPVKTCAFFAEGEHRGFVPEDIIKLMAIIKILSYSEYKYFTMRFLRLEMGYSANHIDKNAYLRELLIILRGFGVVEWECQEVQLANNRKEIRYFITNFDDSYNKIMQNFKKDVEYCNVIEGMSEEEKQKCSLQMIKITRPAFIKSFNKSSACFFCSFSRLLARTLFRAAAALNDSLTQLS